MTEKVQDNAKDAEKKPGLGLTTQIGIALVLGVALGIWLPEVAISFRFMGEIFMAALKMLIVPLIVVTMIVGVASLGSPKELGRLGGRAVTYYFATTALAVVVGLIAVNVMKPGESELPNKLQTALKQTLGSQKAPPTSLSSQHVGQIQTAFAAHLAEGLDKKDKAKQKKTKLLAQQAAVSFAGTLRMYLKSHKTTGKKKVEPITKDMWLQRATGALRAELVFARVGMRQTVKAAADLRARSKKKGPPLTVSRFLYMQIKKVLMNPFKAMATGNVLGIIVFSLLLGLVLVTLGDRGRPALNVADSLNEAMMKMVEWVMLLTPYGVFSLIAYQVARSGWDILLLLGKYMLCVLVALFVHGFIVLPILLFVLGRRSPLKFFSQVRNALGVAFSTSSSSATLPVSMEVSEHNAEVPAKVSGFVLPLGATINMDGTALYEAIAALFIAQIYGIDLGIGAQILIFMTAALAAIGAAGIPSAGTVTMVMVLSAVGLPLSGIGLILAVDRVLDMCRTTVNVWGDLIGAAILGRWETDDDAEASASS